MTTRENDGERLRAREALNRLESHAAAVRMALDDPHPIGLSTTQALTECAGLVACHAAAADAYLRASISERRRA